MKDFLIDIKNSFKAMKWYEWAMTAILIIIAGYNMIMAFVSGGSGGNPPWLTVINFISAICGVVCIFFCAKASSANFIFGLVNTLVYAVYLFYWKIYGTFALEMLFYLPMNILSWINWVKHKDDIQRELTKAKKLTNLQGILGCGAVIIIALICRFFLGLAGGEVIWLDAFTVAIGLWATFLECRRYADQYVWWIITDIVAVAMYIQHFDAVYLTKKSVYLIMAVVGLINWFKLQNERNANNE